MAENEKIPGGNPPGAKKILFHIGLLVLLIAPWFAIADLHSRVEGILYRIDPVRRMSVKVGDAAPDGRFSPFEFFSSCPAGEENVFSAVSKGKPVLFVFWSPECHPCLPKLPLITDWAAAHEGRAVLVAVTDRNMNMPEDGQNWEKYFNSLSPEARDILSRQDVISRLSVDCSDSSGMTLKEKWGVSTIPTFAAIDAKGKVTAISVGNVFPVLEEMERLLKK